MRFSVTYVRQEMLKIDKTRLGRYGPGPRHREEEPEEERQTGECVTLVKFYHIH